MSKSPIKTLINSHLRSRKSTEAQKLIAATDVINVEILRSDIHIALTRLWSVRGGGEGGEPQAVWPVNEAKSENESSGYDVGLHSKVLTPHVKNIWGFGKTIVQRVSLQFQWPCRGDSIAM